MMTASEEYYRGWNAGTWTMTRSGTTPSGLQYSTTLRQDGRTAYMVFRPYAWTEAGSEATHAAAVESVCDVVRRKEREA